MRTYSYISAAALAAALIATPHFAQAQLLGVDVNVGGESGIDADVSVGGENLIDMDVDAGSSDSGDDLLDVEVGGSGGNLVDVSVGGSGTGPNGGRLIDLGAGRTDAAVLDADVTLGGTGDGAGLVNGEIRIGSLGGSAERSAALLRLIEAPNLADIDLDAAIDDRRVSIVTAAELLGSDGLADIEAAIETGGQGRTELLDALSASVELSAILGNEGIDLSDVLAVQVSETGATEMIVLGGDVAVAALGDDGDLATVTADDVAELDIDLLSREELAEVDLDLLPDQVRSTAQLRLLGVEGDAADAPTPADLAAVDLDLLSRDELGELDLTLLPEPVGAAVKARLLGTDGTLAELSIGDLAAIDLTIAAGDGSDTDAGGPGSGGGDSGGDTGGGNGDGAGNGDGGDPGMGGDTDADAAGPASPTAAAPGAGAAGAGLGIAALDCEIGVLALANGVEATPQAIADADSLELVQIEGCERSLVDAEVDQVHAAISRNPAIAEVLDDAQIPLDQVIGATVQADTLTLFIETATAS